MGVARAESPVGSGVAGDWFPVIIGAVWIFGMLGLLAFIACFGQIPVGKPGRELIAPDGHDRRHADKNLATIMCGGKKYRTGGNLRLKDRWHRLSSVGQPA